MRASATGSFVAATEEEITRKTQCTPKVAITTVFLILGSTLSTMSFKTQGLKFGFKHGIFQSVLMFVGEYVNILIFFVIMVELFYSRNQTKPGLGNI